VTVRLADLNGPRGGVDKQCRIIVKLRPGEEVVVKDTASEVETAIDRCADRVQREWPARWGECRGEEQRFFSRPRETRRDRRRPCCHSDFFSFVMRLDRLPAASPRLVRRHRRKRRQSCHSK
jgi:hypothetical protein